VIEVGYAAIQALSCYSAKQAFEARQQASRCATSGFLNLRPADNAHRIAQGIWTGVTSWLGAGVAAVLVYGIWNREEETFA
jgi:hypothetical protein